MVPAASVDATLETIVPHLAPGDMVIDGGNSYYHDDIRRAAELKPKGIHYVDCGTSGGVWGLERGYCLMIGGEDAVVQHLDPIFSVLAPGIKAAPRTSSRSLASQADHGASINCAHTSMTAWRSMVAWTYSIRETKLDASVCLR